MLLFVVDDLGWQDTSLPLYTEETPLNRRYHTPNVERLAERGVAFTNAYAAAPVCTPTRTSLMTGRSPGRTHITYWTLWKDTDQSAAYPEVRAPAWNTNGLQPADVTLPRLLAAAGYRTMHVGKAHFGAVGTDGADPTNLGFEKNVAGHGPGGPASYYGTHDFTVAKRTGKEGAAVWDVPGLEHYHGKELYLTEVLTLEAARLVRRAVEDRVPFFMNFAPYAVHAPIMANERYLFRYADLPEREAAYATMVESVDVALGTLLDLLEELEIADDTLVVYTSDNGGLSAHARDGERHTHNAPLRSGKGSFYEGGIRVPQVIAWPGLARGGSRTDAPVVTQDLFPTVLHWTRVEAPPGYVLDGQDLAPILRGEAWSEPRTLAWHQPHFWGVQGPGIQPFSALRYGAWKLVFRHADRGFELYFLEGDIGETNDLASECPEVVSDLADRMSRWYVEVGAQPSIEIDTGEPLALPSTYVAAGSGR